MKSTLPYNFYIATGWIINLLALFVAIVAVRKRSMWQKEYLWLVLDFCFIASIELVGLITLHLGINNFLLGYLYSPVNFSLLLLYLNPVTKGSKNFIVCTVMVLIFWISQIYLIFHRTEDSHINTIGVYASSSILLVYALWKLNSLFRRKIASTQLRLNPDFWFSATIFSMCFANLFVAVLTDITYISKSPKGFYIVNIPYNLMYALMLFGYYKGITLFRRGPLKFI